MKALLAILFTVFLFFGSASIVPVEQLDFSDTLIFHTGTGDTTYYKFLNGRFSHLYLTVIDTGTSITDSVKSYASVKYTATDSTYSLINMRDVSDYTDGTSSRVAGTTRTYLLTHAYVRGLYLVLSNLFFTNGVEVKIILQGVTRW